MYSFKTRKITTRIVSMFCPTLSASITFLLIHIWTRIWFYEWSKCIRLKVNILYFTTTRKITIRIVSMFCPTLGATITFLMVYIYLNGGSVSFNNGTNRTTILNVSVEHVFTAVIDCWPQAATSSKNCFL